MSRTRKGGKYNGGNFASQFKQGLSMQSPMFKTVVAGGKGLEGVLKSAKEITENAINNLDGKPPALSELEDVIDEKVGSSARRAEIQNWKARAKQEGERLKEEAEKEALAKQREEEAIKAEEEREALSQGANIAGSSDGGKGSGKARRQAKRAAKGAAKDEKRALMDECKGLKGKAKRQCKSGARKNFRKDKKAIRKANRKKRRSNTKKKLGKLFKRK